MKTFRFQLLLFVAWLLTACGAYAPAEPTRSPLEARQTDRAITGAQPTLAPIPTATGPLRPTAVPTLPPATLAQNIAADDPRTLGRPDAPVVIVEYSDFE